VRPIQKLLIANRGEIACRILRTCRALGIATVAVYSDADADARHVREADEAVYIGPAEATSSYLSIPALLEAARRTGADAVHPGYGFLAERAPFALACREAGLTFVGPAPEVIARMGSKREARRLAAVAGVPVVPGYDGDEQDDAHFERAAREIGFPVLVKASAGGGGKGMRVVERGRDLGAALAAARREALAAFGDDTLLLERLIRGARHVEMQIFGDTHGQLVHLGERECTIQRRHQKVIEETPSTALDADLRTRMAEAALAVGRQLGYTNAGTIEFVLDADTNFHFLEVNTRLQVEHPVTELVTRLDLVAWQIAVAEGRPLPLRQEEIVFSGHAVEARLYAEDPAQGFLPAVGNVALWRVPAGDGVRVDAGIQRGDAIGTTYDPLLAKISAHGVDRAAALRRLESALAHTTLLGVRSNLGWLRRVVAHPAHIAGDLTTDFVARHASDLLAAPASGDAEWSPEALAALAAGLARACGQQVPRGIPPGLARETRTESVPLAWRNNRNGPVVERFSAPSDATIELRLMPLDDDRFSVEVASTGRTLAAHVRVREHVPPDLTLEVAGHLRRAVALEAAGGAWWIAVAGEIVTLRWHSPFPDPAHAPRHEAALVAPMPGQVTAVLVADGQTVHAGEALVILTAMKMEHVVASPQDGVVAELRCRAGDSVPAGAVLLDVRPDCERCSP
jgi:acetyl/propionyl-CoA carboxylase alpha subunit